MKIHRFLCEINILDSKTAVLSDGEAVHRLIEILKANKALLPGKLDMEPKKQ